MKQLWYMDLLSIIKRSETVARDFLQPFFIEVAGFRSGIFLKKNETPTQMFSYEFAVL